MKRKVGIVLSGGGARGAYQIGVLKALKKAGLLDDIYAYGGASVGSLNAVLLAMGDLELAESIWLSMDEDSLFKSEESFIKNLFKKGLEVVYSGYYPTDNLEKLIDNILDYKAIKDKNIYVTTTYVGDEDVSFWELLFLNARNAFDDIDHVRYSKLSDLSEEDIKKTLLASCAIPLVFKPVVIQNKTYYDGGVLDNIPYKPLIDAGCDEIIVIELFRFNFRRTHITKDVTMHTLKPSRHLRGVLNFSKDQIQRRFEIGLKDGEKFADKILATRDGER